MNPFHQAPGGVDPYEVAYLRGGRNEVARVVIVSLVERRILELQRPDSGPLRSFVKGSKFIGQRSARPAIRLSELEQAVYDWFAEPRPVGDIFRKSLPEELTPYCLPFEERLQRRQLLRPRGAGAVAALIDFVTRRRLTAEGKAYLKQLRHRNAAAHDPMPYAFAAAVAGTTVLAGTPLADLGGEFKKSQQQAAAGGCGIWTGSGCGTGCGGGGSSCGGSSGCGGGGGCGGGS
jgi:hypothetical protein